MNKSNNFSSEWIDLVDRNRSNENKHIFTIEQWKELYSKHGFKTVKIIPTVKRMFLKVDFAPMDSKSPE